MRSDHFGPRSNPLCLRYSIHPIHYFPEIRPLDKPWARTALRLAQRHFSQGFPSQMAFHLSLYLWEAMKPLKGKYLPVSSIAVKGEHLFWDPSLIGTDAFLSVICLTNEYLYLHRHLFERYHDEGAYLYLLLFFELSSVSTTRGNIGVCRGRELILAPVRLFVISVHFNWPPIRLGPPPSLSGVIKPNHLGDYSQQGCLLRFG